MRSVWLWTVFAGCVLGGVAIDLRRAPPSNDRRASLRVAARWTALWVALAAAFGGGIAVVLGAAAALEFATGYVVEEALSVDNLVVFASIFATFRVPAAAQPRVLIYGIIGALALRGAMIGAGISIVTHVAWVTYVFGLLLVTAGVRLATRADQAAFDPATSRIFAATARLVPFTSEYAGRRFFVRRRDRNGALRCVATPLVVILLAVEVSDAIFALDSIPAVIGVTRNPLLVYSSNAFAVLGLRSAYGMLAGLMNRLRFLRVGVAVVLACVGAKMLLAPVWNAPTLLALGIIVGVLAVSAGASLAFPLRAPADLG